VTDIATIIGIESLIMAFLGSPSNVLTPLVCISGFDNGSVSTENFSFTGGGK